MFKFIVCKWIYELEEDRLAVQYNNDLVVGFELADEEFIDSKQ